MVNIAENIIEKCGGAKAVAEMTGADISRVHRWKYPRERGGTGGVIPARLQGMLLQKARSKGIDLTPSDFFPPTCAPAAPPDGGCNEALENLHDRMPPK